jgi:hypothetical protein
MQRKPAWKSVRDSLPGIAEPVFVYCDKTNRTAGPVCIMENTATEISSLKGIEYNLTTGHGFEKFGGIGIFAYGWFMGGLVFTQFMPTHWTAFPPPPA